MLFHWYKLQKNKATKYPTIEMILAEYIPLNAIQ